VLRILAVGEARPYAGLSPDFRRRPAKILVVQIAAVIALGAVGSALAQPAPDPAPVPNPPTAPAPAPPPVATYQESVAPTPPRAPRPVTKKPPRPAKTPKPAKPSKPLHARLIDARASAAAPSSPLPRPAVVTPPAVALGDGNDGGSLAVRAGFLVLLAAACLALAFAAIPGRVLGTLSTRLTERRDDIGFAVALGMTVTAVMFLVLVVT
jgi:hypothetical protein